jgi:hypothetical protein
MIVKTWKQVPQILLRWTDNLAMGTKVAKSMRLVEWNVDVLQFSNRLSVYEASDPVPFLKAPAVVSTVLSRGSSISNLFEGVAVQR